MNRDIFEGCFRRLPEQNLAGASKHARKNEFLHQLHVDRMNRKNDIVKNESAVKIQSYVRGFLTRVHLKRELRHSFCKKWPSPLQHFNSIDDFGRFVVDFTAVFDQNPDDPYLAPLSEHLFRYRSEIMTLIAQDRSWWVRIEKVLVGHLNKLRRDFYRCSLEQLYTSFRLLLYFPDPRVVNEKVFCSENNGVNTSAISYLNQLWSVLVSHGYFKVVSWLIMKSHDIGDKRINGGNGNSVYSLIYNSVLQALEVTNTSAPVGGPIMEDICKELLQDLVVKDDYNIIAHIIHEQKYDIAFSQFVNVLLSGKVTPNIHTFFTLVDLCKKVDFNVRIEKCLEAFSVICSKLPYTYNPQTSTEDDSDEEGVMDDEDEDEEFEESWTKVFPTNTIKRLDDSFEFLIGPQLSDKIANSLDECCKDKGELLLAVSKFVINIIQLYSSQLHRFKLLTFVSCWPTIHLDLWTLVNHLSRSGDNDSSVSLITIVSNALPLTLEEGKIFFPLLITFCATFKNLLMIHQNPEIFELGASDSQSFPFKGPVLTDISMKLKEILIGLVQMAFPQCNLISFFSIDRDLHPSTIPAAHEDVIRPYSQLLYKEAVGLMKVLHSRDVRNSNSNWTSKNIVIPRPLPFNKMPRVLKLETPFVSANTKGCRFLSQLNSNVLSFLFILKDIPFIVSVKQRIVLLQMHIRNDKSTFQSPVLNQLQPNIFINIRRDYLYEDSFEKLSRDEVPEIRLPVRIQLTSAMGYEEAGVDGGGLFREYLGEFMKTAFDPNRGFFSLTKDNQLYPNPSVKLLYSDFTKHYSFIGRMFGKALYENLLVELPLAEFFIAKLVGKDTELNINSLNALDPEMYRNLISLKSYDGEFSELGLNFSMVSNEFGKTKVVELVPNGEEIAVTKYNRLEYIYCVADYKLNVQIKAQCNAIKQGIASVMPLHWLSMFSTKELQVIISGSDSPIDVDDLYQHTQYSGDCSVNHPNIQMFWKVVQSLSDFERRQLLKFVTSYSRPPLLGFRELDPPFTIQLVESSDRLPTSSTCINLLLLPICLNEEMMKEKILYSIQSGTGFELC